MLQFHNSNNSVDEFSLYSIQEHIHRYALWTAARAASKSLLSNGEVENILLNIGFPDSIKLLKKEILTAEKYDAWHSAQCYLIISAFKKLYGSENGKLKRMKYGIAAKIISVYVKSAEVLPTQGASIISQIAHPPIDSILLRRINNRFPELSLPTKWSLFEQEDYERVIDTLRGIIGEKPFWVIEYYWKIPSANAKQKLQGQLGVGR